MVEASSLGCSKDDLRLRWSQWSCDSDETNSLCRRDPWPYGIPRAGDNDVDVDADVVVAVDADTAAGSARVDFPET